MASITQTIPSFTGGISQQPDELVLPGQVKDLINGIPDITDGLVKRPGTRFISGLTGSAEGVWFSYYRDEDEGAYIGQVQRNGTVKVWDTDGNPQTVSGSATNYLTHTNNDDLKFLTIADTTFVTNVTKEIQRTNAKSQTRAEAWGDTSNQAINKYIAFVELRQLAYGREYSFNVTDGQTDAANITQSGEGRATSLEVELPNYPTINRGGNSQGINPDLEFQGTELYSVSSGSGENLVFRLTVTGQVAVREDIGNDSIQGDDYVGVYNPTVELLSGGYGWRAHNGSDTDDNHVDVDLRGQTYKVKIKSIQEIIARADLGFFRPEPTSFNPNIEVSADSLLSQAEKGTNNGEINLGVVERVGNGIFLANNAPFTVETANPDLWRITPMEINDVSELPRQCKDGFIVRVISSSDTNEDDFYLKFVGENGMDGVGSWEETVAPDVYTTLDANTLPHIIQRQADGTFSVGTYSYSTRAVGDDVTNPFPSFIADLDNNTGRKISQTFFHRNRLGFLCEDNVILSKASEPGNFFQESALVIGGNDPIDIQASSNQPTQLKTALETTTGLVIFAETQQFLLATDSDSLTPDTARVMNISTYRYSPSVEPISLGTTIGFVDNAGTANGRFFEIFDIRREGEPSIVEQTKVAPRLMPSDVDIITNSRENNTVFFAKSGTPDIVGYRYFNTGDRRLQSAWFRWSFKHDIEDVFVIDDELFLISNELNTYQILSLPLAKLDTARDVVGDNFYGTSTANSTFTIHLDSSKEVTAGNGVTYDSSTGYTTMVNTFVGTAGRLAAVNMSTGSIYIEDETQRSPGSFKFFGDFSNEDVTVGWIVEYQVNLPRIFVKQKAGEQTTADVTSSLTIQRVHFRYGEVGQITVRLRRLGKDIVETTYESTPMDFYDADEVPIVSEKTQTVPVYERNKNCNIVLKSNHPGPATLLTMSWEGDYTPMYHKRV